MILTVTSVTTLNEMLELPGAESTGGVGELEGPQEVAGLLEVGSDGVDFVDQILHAHNAVLSEVVLNKLVVAEGSALLVDLPVTTLVDQLADALQVGVTVGDVRVDNGQHLRGSLGQTDEDTVVDLEETEELENLARLRGNLVDTTNPRISIRSYSGGGRINIPLDTDNENQLGLVWNVERAVLLADAGKTDLLALSITVFLNIGFRALEDDATLLLVGLNGDTSQYKRISNNLKLYTRQVLSTNFSPERWLTKRQH